METKNNKGMENFLQVIEADRLAAEQLTNEEKKAIQDFNAAFEKEVVGLKKAGLVVNEEVNDTIYDALGQDPKYKSGIDASRKQCDLSDMYLTQIIRGKQAGGN